MNASTFESAGSMIQQSAEFIPPQEVIRDYMDLGYDQAGPVFVKLPDQMGWIKVNNFSACDQCRTSHVKCSLSVTGGPCNHCKSRNQFCKVYGWVFNPECPAYHIYKPVLPPPPVATSSPLHPSNGEEYIFEWELLVHKLNWLQREAPRKFRKRSSAMPWKDEPNGTASETQDRKGFQSQQRQTSGIKNSNKNTREGAVSGQACKRRRASRGAEGLDCKYDVEGGEPVLPTQHRMSISFILSPYDSEQTSKPEKKSEGSAVSSNGWESRRTSFASSEADWSTRSGTRSPSLPTVNSLPKTIKSNNISIRSPPVPQRIDKHVVLSKFKEWRPHLNHPVVSGRNGTLSTLRSF